MGRSQAGRDEERVGGRPLIDSSPDVVASPRHPSLVPPQTTKLAIKGKGKHKPARDSKEAGRGSASREKDFNKSSSSEDGMLTDFPLQPEVPAEERCRSQFILKHHIPEAQVVEAPGLGGGLATEQLFLRCCRYGYPQA